MKGFCRHGGPAAPGLVVLWMIMIVGLAGCSSLVQAVKNQDCALNPLNPYDVVEIDFDRHELRLFWKKPDGVPFYTLAAVRNWISEQGDSLVAAANAGIYEPGYVPTGLYIEDGQIQRPLNLDEGEGNFYLKPNGVFLVTDRGARIVDAVAFQSLREPVQYAVQSGPLLLNEGAIHPAFNPGSENCRLRSGIGVTKAGKVHLAISNGAVNFENFARFFRDELGSINALYLDGGISEIDAPAMGRADSGRQRFAAILAVIDRKASAAYPSGTE